MVERLESRPVEPLGLLHMRVPASTAARMLTDDESNPVTARQVRKARMAIRCGIRNSALERCVESTANINGESAWRLHHEWIDRDFRQCLEREVWKTLAVYRRIYEREQCRIMTAKQAFYAAELERMVGKRTESYVEELRDAFNVSKSAVDQALEAHEASLAEAKRHGVDLRRHESIQAYRNMLLEGKPEKPKNKKGGGDVHGHHKPSKQQLMEAAGR